MKFTDFINPSAAVESFDRRKLVVFEENKRCYKAKNSNNRAILRLRIDKKLINSSDKKCDFSAIIPPESMEPPYFISDASKKSNEISKEVENNQFEAVDLKRIYSESICFLIETKGCDVSTAAEQIRKTIPEMTKLLGIEKFVGRIVASKCKTQELHTTQYNELLRKLIEINTKYSIQYKPLIKSTDLLEEDI